MRLQCKKCNNILTNDLYIVKKFGKVKYNYQYNGIILDEIPDCTVDDIATPGAAKWTRKTFWYNEHYALAHGDCVGINLTPWQSGNGCCGNSDEPIYCAKCNIELGDEFNDCYQTKHITMFSNAVNRSYAKI